MNKEELFQELSFKISNGEISREELINNFGLNNEKPLEVNKKESNFSITKMLYVLGAAIVIIGIVTFVSQIWYDIGSFGRILVTLGLGLLFTAIGSVLLKDKPEEKLGSVFQFMGGVLIPGGAIVTLLEIYKDDISLMLSAITSGIIFLFYLALNSVHKSPILTFFAIANGTAFVYLLVGALDEASAFGFDFDLYAYLTMVMGISYLLLAHNFCEGWNRKLVGFLYFFGSVGFLGAAFSQVFDSGFWEVIYFFLVMGGLLLAVYMKSLSILIVSTLFLVAHISYITGEYFADSLGWPISLVILGFMFIGLGYISININKKYIAN